MTTTFTNETAALTTRITAMAALRAAVRRFEGWMRMRRSRRELLGLSGRMLRDMGISHSQIDAAIGHSRTGRSSPDGRT